MQRIVYGEYLPAIMGEKSMTENRLNVNHGLRSSYNSNMDPSIRNSFATAAYRFGHSMVRYVGKVLRLLLSLSRIYRYHEKKPARSYQKCSID